MARYLVTWDFFVEDDTPEQAVRQAHATLIDPENTATGFRVAETIDSRYAQSWFFDTSLPEGEALIPNMSDDLPDYLAYVGRTNDNS